MDQALLARCPHHGGYCLVGVLGRHFGLCSPNACRIVYLIKEEASLLMRYGFAFGTLPGHVERGEERFTVEGQRAEDSVFYEVFAFARPAHPLARVGPPFVQLVQRRFAAASLRAMAAAHHSTFQFPRGCRTPLREPLQCIVIAVMSVISGTYPDTYGGYYMTVNR
jgi:hypothetical protein